MNEIVYLLSADIDIQQAYEHHEERNPQSGEDFLRRLDESFGQLQLYPHSGTHYYRGTRRLIVRKTGYAIFYTVTGRRVVISHIAHLGQDPERIRRSLEQAG